MNSLYPNFRQLGLSMVELLVALALSSFLILGVTQIYIDNKRTYAYQQGQSETQENTRFIEMVLESQISKAGYRRRPDESMEQAFPAAEITKTIAGTSTKCSFAPGDSIKRIGESSFCLRYQPRNPQETDCTGAALSSTAGLTTPYTSTNIVITEFISVSNGNLICASSQADTNPATLIQNSVAGIKIQYAIGSAASKGIEEFTNNVNDIGSKTVRGIRYALLIATTGTNLREGIDSNAVCDWQTFDNPEASCTQPTDNRLYQMSSGVITIRNLMP